MEVCCIIYLENFFLLNKGYLVKGYTSNLNLHYYSITKPVKVCSGLCGHDVALCRYCYCTLGTTLTMLRYNLNQAEVLR